MWLATQMSSYITINPSSSLIICNVSIMRTLFKFLGNWIHLSIVSSGTVAHGLAHAKLPTTIVHGVKFPTAITQMQEISMMLYISVADFTTTAMM